MEKIIIRKGTPEDLQAIQKLCNLLSVQSEMFITNVNNKWAESGEGVKYHLERLNEQKGVSFVAEKNGEIIGFASTTLHPVDDWDLVVRAELDNLYVVDAARGNGIGKRLLDEVKTWAKEKGAKRLILTAYTKNTQAIDFYQREQMAPYETTLALELP